MKKIAVMGYTPFALDIHRKTLEKIFKDKVSLELVVLSKPVENIINADVAIIIAPDFAEYAKEHLRPNTKSVLASYTIEKEAFNKIKDMEEHGIISIVSAGKKFASTRKILLEKLGIEKNKMIIWYPNMKEDELTNNIVLFGQTNISHIESKNIVHIPGRLLSVSTIIDVALALNLPEVLSSPDFKEYYNEVCEHYKAFSNELTLSEYYSNMGNENLKEGMVFFSPSFTIYNSDLYIENIANKMQREIIGKKVWDIFPFLKGHESTKFKDFKDKVVKYNNKTYIVNIDLISQHNIEYGYVRISNYWEEENRHNNIRRQVINKKHIAKYTFDDIVGVSPKLQECKQVAERMSKSNSSVMIIGDTGVGKELFAQSIHNNSPRKNHPFIAVNCGAFVESLLESELFGYEKGAFTGANKEGKQGLFELAHKGTLFLDEIGEMPLHLQVRLLRVLQEKEVVRIGGDNIIPIDVRIIAATNKDLYEMVNKNQFRSDLFYRLNILPLNIPPLSKRKDDIEFLINVFIKEIGIPLTLSPAARERIMNYHFPGNVRELRNLVEYLSNLGHDYISVEDLPSYINISNISLEEQDIKNLVAKFENNCDDETLNKKINILFSVLQINRMGVGAGRRSVKSYLINNKIAIPEKIIREILDTLNIEKFILIQKGRAGIKIQPDGEKIINYYIDSKKLYSNPNVFNSLTINPIK